MAEGPDIQPGTLKVFLRPGQPQPRRWGTITFTGRACCHPLMDCRPGWYHETFIVPGDSRFTGASIAGLVVGAMGVFVFSVALRHWLKERKAIVVQEAS